MTRCIPDCIITYYSIKVYHKKEFLIVLFFFYNARMNYQYITDKLHKKARKQN